MLTVVTAAFYKDRSGIRYLEDTCERFGLKLRPYGIGEQYRGYFNAKVTRLREALNGVDTEYTLYCDGADSLILGDQERILKAYSKTGMNGELLFSAEQKPYPYDNLGRQFEVMAKNVEALECTWKKKKGRRIYLSAGVFMGRTNEMVKALDTLLRLYRQKRDKVSSPDDDQGWWYIAVDEGAVDVGVDYQGHVVATTKYTPLDWYKVTEGSCRLLPNQVKPCLLHFAGVIHKRDWMPIFYGRLFHDDNVPIQKQ